MSSHVEVIFLCLFVLLFYYLSKIIGKDYQINIHDDSFSIKRNLVVQIIHVADIKKVTIKKNSIFFRGNFLVTRGKGKSWKIATIELTNNKKNDLETVKAFLLRKGF